MDQGSDLNININFKNKKRKVSKDYIFENDWKSGKCWACHLVEIIINKFIQKLII